MAESGLIGLRAPAMCASCGKEMSADASVPATFCPGCGCCLLNVAGGGGLQPLVPPRVEEQAAWSRLLEAMPRAEAARVVMTAARLLFVPFHEWPPDVSRTRLVKDARAVLSPAGDLLPAGFLAPAPPLGAGRRGLAIADHAHEARLADPKEALGLIRRGEAVDVMIDPPVRPPDGANPNAAPHLLYYPFWLLTYRLDWKEHTGVVDAAMGRPVGSSSAPSRWVPAAWAAAVGAAAFLVLFVLLKPAGSPVVQGLVSAAGSWTAAAIAFARLVRRERGR